MDGRGEVVVNEEHQQRQGAMNLMLFRSSFSLPLVSLRCGFGRASVNLRKMDFLPKKHRSNRETTGSSEGCKTIASP